MSVWWWYNATRNCARACGRVCMLPSHSHVAQRRAACGAFRKENCPDSCLDFVYITLPFRIPTAVRNQTKATPFNNFKTKVCGTKDQTIDHLLFECELLNKERDRLILTVSKADLWPISKNELIRKHYKLFTRFTKEISFDKLNEV